MTTEQDFYALKEKADNGDPVAQIKVGMHYLKGKHVACDKHAAVSYFKLAEGKVKFTNTYDTALALLEDFDLNKFEPFNVPDNKEQETKNLEVAEGAYKFLRLAAKDGNTQAKVLLVVCNLCGVGWADNVIKNITAVVDLAKQACDVSNNFAPNDNLVSDDNLGSSNIFDSDDSFAAPGDFGSDDAFGSDDSFGAMGSFDDECSFGAPGDFGSADGFESDDAFRDGFEEGATCCDIIPEEVQHTGVFTLGKYNYDYSALFNELIDHFDNREINGDELGEILHYLGISYSYHNDDEVNNFELAAKLYKLAGYFSCDNALRYLGHLYLYGKGVPQDDVKALEYIKQSATENCDEGVFDLAACYQLGRGVEQDFAKAAELYRKAAQEYGYIVAYSHLGLCYEHGLGVPQDFEKAFECYENAQDKYPCDGLYNLGRSYHKGIGVVVDYELAYRCFKKAAKNLQPDAQNILGHWHEHGIATGIDPATGFNYFKDAAGQSDKDIFTILSYFPDNSKEEGLYNVGRCLYHGIGVDKDEERGRDFMQQAADRGYQEASDALAKL